MAELKVKLVIDKSQFEQGIIEAKGSIEGLGDESKKGGTSAIELAKGFLAAEVAMKAFGIAVDVAKAGLSLLVDQVGEGVKGAIEAEQAETRFAQALRARGQFTEEALQKSKDFANQLAQTTTFTDEEVLASQRLFVSLGGLSNDALPGATRAAADLAAGLGVDLAQASTLLSKAAAGNEEALGRLGIKIDENIPEAEKFAEVMRQVQERFGGAAAAELDTFGGKLGNLQKTWGELLEQVGNFIIQSPAVQQIIANITALVQGWTGGLEGNKRGHEAVAAAIGVAKTAFSILADALGIVIRLGAGLIATYDVLKGSALIVGSTTVGAVASMIEAWNDLTSGIERLWLQSQLVVIEGIGEIAKQTMVLAGVFSKDLQGALIELEFAAFDAARKVKGELAKPPDQSETVASLRTTQGELYNMGQEAFDAAKKVEASSAQMVAGIQSVENAVLSTKAAGGPAAAGDAAQAEVDRQATIANVRAQAAEREKEREEAERQEKIAKDVEAERIKLEEIQKLREEDSIKGRDQRQKDLEEDHAFLADLAEAFNVTGTTFNDFMAAAGETLRGAFVDSFLAIEAAASDAIFTAIKGGDDISKVWQKLGDTLLKTMIDALVRIAAQFIINRIIAATVAKSTGSTQLATEFALIYARAFASVVGIPIVGPAIAPGVAAGAVASAQAGSAASGGAGSAIGQSFQVGSEFIEETGPAIVHQGERIIQSDINRDLTDFLRRQEAGGGGGGSVMVTVNVGEFVGSDEQRHRLVREIRDAIQLERANFDLS